MTGRDNQTSDGTAIVRAWRATFGERMSMEFASKMSDRGVTAADIGVVATLARLLHAADAGEYDAEDDFTYPPPPPDIIALDLVEVVADLLVLGLPRAEAFDWAAVHAHRDDRASDFRDRIRGLWSVAADGTEPNIVSWSRRLGSCAAAAFAAGLHLDEVAADLDGGSVNGEGLRMLASLRGYRFLDPAELG